MKRNKHSLSHYRLLTADMGKLIPVACFEVLPGDSVQQATSMLLRVSPLLAPVMHPVTVRVHHWFVPHRLVWDGWEDFITGGPDGIGGDSGAYPVADTGVAGIPEGSIGDYLGVPPGVANMSVSGFPVASYCQIYNEFYRDQDLCPEIDYLSPGVYGLGDGPLNVAWEKDYFTSARPWPQKGPDVSLPLGVSAPVNAAGDQRPTFYTSTDPTPRNLGVQAPDDVTLIGHASGPSTVAWSDPKLIADLTNATAVNVNDVRRAFALQRYQEARARYGSRYTEYLRYLGVRSSDARLQRPEYLGGGKQTIAFSEILQTGPGTEPEDVVGSLKGHGIAAMRSRRYRRFFEEHGLVLSLMSVRPRTMYVEHLPKLWSRRTKEDYWQRELEQIGQQAIAAKEVFAAGTAAGGDAEWGYQDRYAEYKHIQSTVHGEFRDLLNYWHLGRTFASSPTLNQSFVECDPSKRIHAEQTQNSLWIMVNNSIQARRMVSKGAGSRIM